MRYTDHRLLVDRGRKAGLGTAELYSALGAHRPAAGSRSAAETDGNGFIAAYDGSGRRFPRPAGSPGRS